MHKLTCSLIALTCSLSLPAAVPLRWTVESSRVQPAQFDAFKGESIALEAALQSYGKPLEIEGEPALYWQTNGMGAAWWTAPAAVSSNVLSATWTPAMDVGASAYTCFIGITGSIYRAAFQLRVRHAPGDVPNELPLPVPTLDFDRVTVLHPPWPSIETVPPIVSNVVTKAYVEALGITGDTNAVKALIETEAGPTNAIVRLVEDSDGNRTALLVGTTTNELGSGAVAFGLGVDASGRRAVAIGNYARARTYNSIAIGETAHASGFEPSVAIGSGAAASGDHSVAIGTLAWATGFGSVAIGGHAEGDEAVAIGRGATASDDNSFVWSGINSPYSSGNGTFTVNPRGGADGFYIGMLPLSWLIRDDARIAATNAIDESLAVDGAISRYVTGQVIPAYEASINYTDAATNATLAAANAYTDAHAGTGGLSTNAVLALIEDSVGGTNAVRAAIAHTAVGPTWMRPNAWRITASPTRDVAEIAAVYYTTNNFRTYSNEVARVITTRSAQLRGERLDRYAVDPLIVTNFAAVTPGCSVDELGYVTAEADGQYRVSGTDSTGETRYCDIWFSAGIRDIVLNTIYVGDLAPHLAAANDAALDVLANAALVGTYTVAGKTCNQYSTIAPAFAKSGAHGYYNPWAVSPHILMTAGHMGDLGNRGPISYGGHTVNRVRAVWLKDWALTNGFTEAEVNAVSMIGDIEMIVCDNSGALPAEILPTFISPAAFAARFPGGIRGALLWSANQHHADMVPRVAMNDHGYYLYGDADFAAYPARADLAGRLAAMGQQHIFHGGDSGHVVFLRDDGYDIPITQYYSASTGPDLITAFPMIKAFVESLGDTLKEVE